jgi:hypothetical protein
MDTKQPDGVKAVSVSKRAENESRVSVQLDSNLTADGDVLYDVRLEDGTELAILRVEQVASASGDKVRTVITVDTGSTKRVAK